MKFLYGIFLVSIFVFEGCSVKTHPPVNQYTLSSLHVTKKTTHTSSCSDKSIKVLSPFAAYEYTTNDMNFVVDGLEEGKYQQSAWSRTIAESVYDGIIRTIRSNKLFKSVENYTSVARSDYDLEVEISDFKQYFSKDLQSSNVVVAVTFTLVERENYGIVEQKQIYLKIPAKTPDAKGGVEALNEANVKMLEEMFQWLDGVCK
jgi:cholesterol transport system auxiliary component